MLRLIPKNQQKRQIPPELASLGLPERLLERLVDREIDTPEKIERYLQPKDVYKRQKLDFLVQELNREVNTIGSKASDTQIAGCVVATKGEIEKLREQVQNIE